MHVNNLPQFLDPISLRSGHDFAATHQLPALLEGLIRRHVDQEHERRRLVTAPMAAESAEPDNKVSAKSPGPRAIRAAESDLATASSTPAS